MKKVAILLGLMALITVSCENSELESQDSKVSWTSCIQNTLKSSELSDKIDIKFIDKGIQIKHNSFGVTCDFTTVNVSHTFENGVLNIIQQGFPNQANCICYTDVSYTIDGISQDEVNVIFINGEQIYCHNGIQSDKDVIVSATEYENVPDSHVEIIDAKIVDNLLKIKFSASGCSGSSWNVKLICMGDYMKSDPPQTSLRLSLDNNEDCTAVITKEVSFNLEPLIEYFKYFGTNNIYLNISDKRVLFTFSEQKQVFDPNLIKKGWLHSQEEDGENSYSIYRPSDYKEFPPSRFRQYFEFKDDNVCSYLVLAPNDAHYIQDGVWEFDESTNIIKIINETDVIFEFQILELKKNILKVRML